MSIDEKMGKRCRACLSTNDRYSDFVSLFSGGCAASEIPAKIMNISDVLVEENDGLPAVICQKCVFLVKVADRFKQQLQMADRELRKFPDRADVAEESSSNCKIDASGTDTDIEELAYDPEYLSDKVKSDVEKVFRRKHKNVCDEGYENMSQFLKNLDEKPFFGRKTIKKEIVNNENFGNSVENGTSTLEKTDSTENSNAKDDKSGECLKNESKIGVKIETTDFVAIDCIAVQNFHEKSNIPRETNVADVAKIIPKKKSNRSYETEAENSVELRIEQNNDEENLNPNIIVISDTSDDESPKSVEKNSQPTLKNSPKFKNDVSTSHLSRGDKRKLSAAVFTASKKYASNSENFHPASENSPKSKNDVSTSKSSKGEKRKLSPDNLSSAKKSTIVKTPKINVKKIFRSLEAVKRPKLQSKIAPRTYFLCTSCNVRLQSVADVLLHHNEVHSQNKNSLHCRMCDKGFATKSHLLEHFDQHVETHLFRCSYCPNEFVLKDNLTRHVLNHAKKIEFATRNKRMKTSDSNSTDERKPEVAKNGEKIDDDSEKENKITKNS